MQKAEKAEEIKEEQRKKSYKLPGQFLKLKKYCGLNTIAKPNIAWNAVQNCIYQLSGRNIVITYLSDREVLDDLSD